MLEPHLNLRCPEGEGVWALSPGVRAALKDALGAEGLIVDPAEMGALLGDASPVQPVTPAAVAIPGDLNALSAVLALAHREGIPVTPRGGGSGKVGGAIPLYGGILLCTHHLPAAVAVDAQSRTLRAGVGATLDAVKAAALAEGLFYPPDPGAGWALIGGTIATNAGGPSAMKYGVTSESVLALTVALATGEILEIGHRSPKGVVGLDLVRLFAGSEGTLGVILDATLKLRPAPEAQRALFAGFSGVGAALDALGALMTSGLEPRAAELFDRRALAALSTSTQGLIPPAGAGLLIALDGPEAGIRAQLTRAADRLAPHVSVPLVVGEEAVESGRLWEARRGLSRAVKAGFTHYVSEDVGVPPSRLAELVSELEALEVRTGLHILCYGHAGDGNLHVNVLFNDLAARPTVDGAVEAIFRSALALGGTLSGEHGVGAAKRAYLPMEVGARARGLMTEVKAVFDPKGIMNPGKGY